MYVPTDQPTNVYVHTDRRVVKNVNVENYAILKIDF